MPHMHHDGWPDNACTRSELDSLEYQRWLDGLDRVVGYIIGEISIVDEKLSTIIDLQMTITDYLTVISEIQCEVTDEEVSTGDELDVSTQG